ncbi:hypothetical protein JQK88_26285 [Mesorhizobium caraganae]|uniref:hypothetical protein n=1 Tax=Mesorhizobium caraganae TaxID=483206 RepID=UPI00193ACF38|nr:hypothetical protein [Mesorhizobium caraganae]MBM2714670.1 hypothetical protein [Mesorhizobium caraganae]
MSITFILNDEVLNDQAARAQTGDGGSFVDTDMAYFQSAGRDDSLQLAGAPSGSTLHHVRQSKLHHSRHL